jgi:hypothetical protein
MIAQMGFVAPDFLSQISEEGTGDQSDCQQAEEGAGERRAFQFAPVVCSNVMKDEISTAGLMKDGLRGLAWPEEGTQPFVRFGLEEIFWVARRDVVRVEVEYLSPRALDDSDCLEVVVLALSRLGRPFRLDEFGAELQGFLDEDRIGWRLLGGEVVNLDGENSVGGEKEEGGSERD